MSMSADKTNRTRIGTDTQKRGIKDVSYVFSFTNGGQWCYVQGWGVWQRNRFVGEEEEDQELCFESRLRFLFNIQVKMLNRQLDTEFRVVYVWNINMETTSMQI